MDDREKTMKVKMLQDTLRQDFGINSVVELIEAMRTMTPVDISMFVVPSAGKDFSSCRITKT